ncbi:MAG: phosphoglycerate kinase [Candidatus Marinimicrobia bacterium]|jgi:phosphoglycerate kinase|nr:phosphoglycerate kinase [Candidatus Neomarinimicrobiota bacterium]MBT3574581.1 phosphoglycerate kinase [Candidatus Neomarinimicrobiota bacterium]MBT3680451.1 phosphoglycerate kinase [Candidatus Neomarinimicrobiota bacterium]MBT3951008.1 phosphoglycerate kinase [Candidatus Neomarinimicrobiota bacterium]MBT4253044.1 phosphoglycerate kinase [Candidatus Neomarinimicrobiota bacterium]
MMPKHVKDLELQGKKVFVRTDYNVPLDSEGQLTDDFRIRSSLPTIEFLLAQGAAVIVASHLGRPKGAVIPEMSLAPVAKRLGELIQAKVIFAPDCVGPEVNALADALQPGQVLLLENLRFHAAETKNDSEFSEQLASLADVYVNDAFGTAHRAHASNVGMTAFFDDKAAGFLLMKEIEFLVSAIENPVRPFTVVMGGSKVSGKIDLLKRLAEVADNILIGGGMAFTFLSAPPLNHNVGSSLVEEDRIQFAADVIDLCLAKGVNLVLPSDCIAANEFSETAKSQELPIRGLEDDLMGLDIGGRTVKSFSSILDDSKTVLWNGPMGVFEMAPFENGTKAIAEKLCEITKQGATTIVGGGDSAAALSKFGLDGGVTHTSTGGGASLELLSGIALPAFEALKGAK